MKKKIGNHLFFTLIFDNRDFNQIIISFMQSMIVLYF
jgi:hypothetical protein